jgi:hypothetical protein
MEQNKLQVFLDSIGRTIIGINVKEDDTTIEVKNPAIVAVQANPQTNQLSLQMLPLFFKEFHQNQDEASSWTFNKSAITRSDVSAFAPQFERQYEQLFAPRQQPKEPEVIKLFDDAEAK